MSYYSFSCISVKDSFATDAIEEIHKQAFYSTKITSLQLPSKLKLLEYGAFGKITTLIGKVIIPENLEEIDQLVFYQCSGLNSVEFNDKLKKIGTSAFYQCTGLKEIIIPDSVTSIGNLAFCDCKSLTSITIPDSVISIGNRAFEGCTSLATAPELPATTLA